jgi:hypothetical protein
MVAHTATARYFPNMKQFKDMLSTRAKNGLSRCFGRQALDTPEVIAEAGMDRLRLAVGLGSKSLQEIAFALCKFECIDDIDKWLGS